MAMDDTGRYNAAKLQVQRLRGFYIHLSIYLLVNALLLAIDLATTPDHLWFYWPLLGWGIGILAHGLAVNFSTEEKVRRRGRSRRAAS